MALPRRTGQRTWLLTEREFADCRVRFEYRLTRGANSGFAFRAVPGERPPLGPGGKPTPGAYHLQVELNDDGDPAALRFPTGQIHGGTTATGPALKPQGPARLRPAGEWNAAEVELRGQRIRVVVNGAEVLAGDLGRLVEARSPYPGLTRPAGRIGFQQQQEGAAGFRAITVEELPPAAP